MHRRDFLQRAGAATIAAAGGLNLADAEDRVDQMPDYQPTGVKLVAGLPANDGFHLPAEWDKHEATIMAFPPPQNWRDFDIPLRDVFDQWARVANKISEFEDVMMVVRPEEMTVAKRILARAIELVEMPLNDGWARDTGPMLLVNEDGERRVAGFTFNGWGAKFPPYAADALLKARLAKELGVAMYPIDLVLEGGGVVTDGDGTLITTEQCLLNENRNGRTKAEVEKLLKLSLGATKVIWLKDGLVPDPITDGHIDGILAYAAPGVVLLHTTADRRDPNYKICQDAKRRLADAKDAKGRRLEVVELPLTADEVCHINFYIGNDCVIVPTAGRRRQDARPLAILRDVFEDREVVGIEASVLGAGGGGIHCITQQIPAV